MARTTRAIVSPRVQARAARGTAKPQARPRPLAALRYPGGPLPPADQTDTPRPPAVQTERPAGARQAVAVADDRAGAVTWAAREGAPCPWGRRPWGRRPWAPGRAPARPARGPPGR